MPAKDAILPEPGPAGQDSTNGPTIPSVDEDPMFGAAFEEAFKRDQAHLRGEAPEEPLLDPDADHAQSLPDKTETSKAGDKSDDEIDLTAEPDDKTSELDLLDEEKKEDVEEDAMADVPQAAPKTSADWKKFRSKLAEERALRKDREAKLAEFESSKDRLTQYEELVKERDTLAQQVKEANILSDPAITKDIDEQIVSNGKAAIAGLSEQQAQQFAAITRIPPGTHRDKILTEFTEEMSVFKQAALATALTNIDALNVAKSTRLEQARANADQIIKQRQTQKQLEERQRKEISEKAFNDVLNEMKGRDGWKVLLSKIPDGVTKAKETFMGTVNDPHDLARVAVSGAYAQQILELAIQNSKKLSEAEKMIAKLRGSSPGIDTSGSQQKAEHDAPAGMENFW